MLQPLLVEESGDGNYLIIAGERRYRAALKAGIETVPILPRSFTPTEKLEIALIENLQREDLNPIEEARAYQSLMETANATQDELSKRLGKNRSTIANALRLLRLPVSVQEAVAAGRLSPGHARAVLSVENVDGRADLAEALLSQDVSVRVAERAAALVNAGTAPEEALRRAARGAGDSAGEGCRRRRGCGGCGGAGSARDRWIRGCRGGRQRSAACRNRTGSPGAPGNPRYPSRLRGAGEDRDRVSFHLGLEPYPRVDWRSLRRRVSFVRAPWPCPHALGNETGHGTIAVAWRPPGCPPRRSATAARRCG